LIDLYKLFVHRSVVKTRKYFLFCGCYTGP